jgi:phosphocarrier protein HPr
MLTKNFVVQNPSGLHARPATLFVQKATSFPCSVNVTKGTKKINGKSIMALMTLGITKGDEVTLEVDGDEEDKAMAALGSILEKVHE